MFGTTFDGHTVTFAFHTVGPVGSTNRQENASMALTSREGSSYQRWCEVVAGVGKRLLFRACRRRMHIHPTMPTRRSVWQGHSSLYYGTRSIWVPSQSTRGACVIYVTRKSNLPSNSEYDFTASTRCSCCIIKLVASSLLA